MLVTVFFKVSVYLYSAVTIMVELFKLKNHQQILLPTGGTLVFWSLIIASNTAEHGVEGFNTAPYFLHIPMLMVIPLLMVIVSLIRSRLKKAKEEKMEAGSNST